eukprot:344560-Prorocentrum_minimum.AAC.1
MVKAVVLRIDSPGGDALASDLMWREIRLLAKEKPVVASMADVAASGAPAVPYCLTVPHCTHCLTVPTGAELRCGGGDVTGGYYMAMAGTKIVAESLTLTGSIGVVTGKFNLAELYKKVG